MNTINYIPKTGIWSDSTNAIDDNFLIFESEISNVEDDARKCKGLFPDLTTLGLTYPTAATGSWACVGRELPALIYIFIGGRWVSTEKIGGGELDPSIYANSVPLNGNADSLFTVRSEWIQSYNEGETWGNVTNGKLDLREGATSYILRLKRLTYGELGDMLIPSISETNLYIFNESKGKCLSMNILSSDGISHTTTEDTNLSWTINDEYFNSTVGNNVSNRLPVEGDTLRLTMKFTIKGDDDSRLSTSVFKFSS